MELKTDVAIGTGAARKLPAYQPSTHNSERVMRLADFILTNRAAILAEWEEFAKSCAPASASMGITALSDHAPSAADRGHGLFRRCWELVMSAPPATAGASPTRR